MSETIFDKIVAGEMDAYIVWEDDDYMAFLTPFPNTPGHTVVIQKQNPGDYVFSVDDVSFHGIMEAARKVAKKLEVAFGTNRVGMLFHGLGVPHLHAQLIPFHANLDPNEDKALAFRKEHPEFAHELTASDGKKMAGEDLKKYQKMVEEADSEI